ncbi:MAG: ABC transporter permease [Candidatus Omnitrophica bacterium]|nr:ABC transporter permease [Candidatus Omnitrophota bacterium]
MQFKYRKKILAIRHALAAFGSKSIELFREAGGISILFAKTLYSMATAAWRRSHIMDQMNKIGVTSLPLVLLTALFTGMVLALQSAYQLRTFNAVRYTAGLVSLSIIRELGPVLTAMVVAGRVGASITAELGTMKVTEQIDALVSLGTDPIKYLVVPRFIAAVLMLPLLTVYADFIGMFGGYIVAVLKLDIGSSLYIRDSFDVLIFKDVFTGLIKSFAFGAIIAIVGCYQGFRTSGGAEGVGKATTISVVTSLVLIIASDCFFTAIFYFVFP